MLPLMVALVLFAGLVYFIFPTTTWLDQRAEASEVQQELDELVAEQQVLRTEIARMRTDDEIQRIARRDFNFVFPRRRGIRSPAVAAVTRVITNELAIQSALRRGPGLTRTSREPDPR